MSTFLAPLILFSVFITSILSGILGMAGGMVLMGVLTWVLTVQQAMLVHATSQFFANGSRAFIHREHIHMPSVKYYLAGLALSLIFFCLVAFMPNKTLVFFMLGIGPFIPLLLRGRVKFDFLKPAQAFFCGVIVTCLHLTAGVSGPLLDMFFQKINMTRHQVVATKAFTQCIAHTVKFVYFGAIVPVAASHGSDWLPLWIYLAIIPTAMLGTRLSKSILDKITDGQFYKATQWLLWAMGAFYLAKAAYLLQSGA